MTDPDEIELPPDAGLLQAAALLWRHAHEFAAEALRRQPPGYQAQLMRAIDAGACALTVQCALPSGEVVALADGNGWPQPACLLVAQPRGERLPMQSLCESIAERALRLLDADAEVFGELADGLASLAVQADWPGDGMRVLLHRPGWSEPQCVLTLCATGPAEVRHDA